MPKNRHSPQSDGDKLYSISGLLIHTTEKAYLFQPKGSEKKVWLPKSQVEYEAGLVTIPEWLVIEKELENLVDED